MRVKPLTEFLEKSEKLEGQTPKFEKQEGPWKLPEGWKWVKIKDIAVDTERRDPTKNPELEFWYIDIASVDNVTHQIVGPKKLKGKDAPSRARKVVKAGDVIFATTRPYLKNVAIIPPELDNQICSTGFAVLRVIPEKTIPKWLFYYLISDFAIELIKPLMRGANYPAITDKDLFNLIIPLPPLEEQKRIVAKLDEIRLRIEEARRLVRDAKEEAEKLIASALHEIFSKAEKRSWEWVRLGNIAEIVMGQSPPSKTYNTEGVGLPFYQGCADFGEFYPTPRVWCTSPSKIAEKGDILISVRAPVGPVNIAKEKCGIGRGLAAIRIIDKNISSKFIFYFLRFFEDKWIGFGSTFDAIRKKELMNLPIPIPFYSGKPNIEEQKRIVAYLDAIGERARQLVRLYEEMEKELEKLWFSVLDKAFKGEL